MATTELAWRSLHDLGLASWFGGSVFGTVALPHSRRRDGDRRRQPVPQRDVEGRDLAAVEPRGDRVHGRAPGRRGRAPARQPRAAPLPEGRRRHERGEDRAHRHRRRAHVAAAADGYRSQDRRRRLRSGRRPGAALDAGACRPSHARRRVADPGDHGRAGGAGRARGRAAASARGAGRRRGERDRLRPGRRPARAVGAARDAFQDAAQRVPTSALDALPGR